MVTDDPGILDPGQWEIIVAATWTENKDGHSFKELPLLDVSVGLTENVQLSAVYPYVFVDLDEQGRGDDFGNFEAALKWRFWNREKLQIAAGAAYLDGISATTARLGIGSDDPIWTLPVVLEYTFGDWTLDVQATYASIRNQEDEAGYGIALGHPAGSRVQLMAELYGATNSQFEDNFLNFTVGADIEITPSWHLLLSGGSGISEPAGAEVLDYNIFVGIQYFTGM